MRLCDFDSLQKLSYLCCKTKSPYSSNDLNSLKNLFILIKENILDLEIISWIKMQESLLPLELLWLLQHHNLLQFTTYVYYNVNLIHHISWSFEEVIWCQDESVRPDCSKIVAGLLTELVNLGTHTPRHVFRLGQQLLTDVVDKFVNRLLSDSISSREPVPFLDELANNPACVQSKVQIYFLSILRKIVQYSPNSVSLEEAVQDQAKLYTSWRTPKTVKYVLNEIISNVSTEVFVTELNKIVTSEKDFNWQWLLSSASTLVCHSKEGTESLKSITDRWLSQACSGKDSYLLATAVLCARQGCAENSQWFGSYSSWFGGIHLRPAASFIFLFNFLSQLVPHEPVLCLKIHVNKVPSVPPNCHRVVADYAALAKTRLADLNQTTDYVGLFGEYTTTEQEGREADVAKVIAHFSQTKEVMKVVLEASIFRRQFYEKVFLNELLKDTNPKKTDFIEKLNSIGKIPHGFYSRWKLLCL